MKYSLVAVAAGTLALSGCGWFGDNEKAALEQAWLAKDTEIQSAIEQIRSQGLDAVSKSAAAGSVAACIADKLAKDPLGDLATVEGALTESAKVAELLAGIESALAQDLSLENAAALLQKGADVAAYAKTLIAEQGLEGASKTLAAMASQTEALASQDLGQHFQSLISSCKAPAAPAAN